MEKIFIVIFSVFLCLPGLAQEIPYQLEDSICKHGKKYEVQKRLDIVFPEQNVTYEFKKAELHKAIPESFRTDVDLAPENYSDWLLYQYYFGTDSLFIYDQESGTLVKAPGERLFNIVSDCHFFDMDGDGLLDFIHYPKYHNDYEDYKSAKTGTAKYELFIQKKDKGYKSISFNGYIVDIMMDKDQTLKGIKTYIPTCCGGNQSTYVYYSFDKKMKKLIITKTEQVLDCQFVEKK